MSCLYHKRHNSLKYLPYLLDYKRKAGEEIIKDNLPWVYGQNGKYVIVRVVLFVEVIVNNLILL